MNITHRNATLKDADILFDWVSDPITRKNSFDSSPIIWDTHINWLNKKLNDPLCKFYIFYLDYEPIGVVRLEQNEQMIIGVTIAPEFRGKGLGSEIIKQGCLEYWKENDSDILAYIKKENLTSKRSFEKAGFTLHSDICFRETECLILIARKNEDRSVQQ